MADQKNNVTPSHDLAQPEDQSKSEKYAIQVWTHPRVAEKIDKAILKNPAYNASMQELETHEDGDLVKIRLRFRNCGRSQFHERMFHLLTTM